VFTHGFTISAEPVDPIGISDTEGWKPLYDIRLPIHCVFVGQYEVLCCTDSGWIYYFS
jgi:hypothetical protein